MTRTSIVTVLVSLVLAIPAADAAAEAEFLAAKPIWPEGRRLEKNVQAAFRAVVDLDDPSGVTLRLAAATLYRATVNGRHAGYGPARGPHGWQRVDIIAISPYLKKGKNVVALEVAGYNVNSYYTIDRALVPPGRGPPGREGPRRHRRLRRRGLRGRGPRRAGPENSALQLPAALLGGLADPARTRPLEVRPRGALRRRPRRPSTAARCAISSTGSSPGPTSRCAVTYGPRGSRLGGAPRRLPASPWKDRSLTTIGPTLKGYPEAELETIPSSDLQAIGSPPCALREARPPGEAGPPRALDAPHPRRRPQRHGVHWRDGERPGALERSSSPSTRSSRGATWTSSASAA